MSSTSIQTKRAYQATIGPEVKYNDIGQVPTASTTTTLFTLMNALTLGTSNSANRIGAKVQCRGLEIRWACNEPAAPDNAVNMRIGLLIDFQANGAAPAAADIWNVAASGAVVFNHRNMNFTERFKILKDEIVSLSALGPGVASGVWHIPCDVVTKYISNTGTVADIETGAIYLYSMSDEAAAATNPLFTFTARYKYIDP